MKITYVSRAALICIPIEEQVELCIKHLICPLCAGKLIKTQILEKRDNNYEDVFRCERGCGFIAKKSAYRYLSLSGEKI